MTTQKDNKMSSRMKGAFGKMKSSKMKFNMTKPGGHSGKSTKQLKNMFNRFAKPKDDDQKWSSILSGSWEIELPVGEFLNAPPPSSDSSHSDHKKEKNKEISDPNSVSNRQCPMVQIYENLKVICIPLSTDIANPQIHQKYLKSKYINTNATRLKVSDKNKIKLLHFKESELENDATNPNYIILEGSININNYTIRWSDGSSWSKQGVVVKEEEEIDHSVTHSITDNNSNIITTQEIIALRSQLEILREKEQMAKSQTQATMGQFADLSQDYAKLTTEHGQVEKEHKEMSAKYALMKKELSSMREILNKNNMELEQVRGDMVFTKQMEIQEKLTSLKKENGQYSASIKLQQERILSLQDQLQTGHIATRQYTKSIQDLEAKISIIEKEKQETKRVLNEMNNKFVKSQTNLDDLKHKEMIINDKHIKDINALNDKHLNEIDKLERGFQETLRQNERKMQEMQTLRNSYEKKNASLSKDVKRLIIQLEKQAKNTYHNSVSKNIDFSSIMDETEVVKKLRGENAQLSEELMRKSQSLVDALRALAEFNRNPVDITKAITSNLSHARKYIYNEEKADITYNDVSNQVKLSMERQNSISATPPITTASSTIIGAKYSINDINALNAAPATRKHEKNVKFNRLKHKFENKMKQQLTKMQQKKVNEEIQRRKELYVGMSGDEALSELNAKTVIKESENVLITKSKQQLNAQCGELQGLANELSSTIEQKEVILESLRFANTYLGKRVIALEKLMNFTPGKEIKNQEELIRDALNISPIEENYNANMNVEQIETKTQEIASENVEVKSEQIEDMNKEEIERKIEEDVHLVNNVRDDAHGQVQDDDNKKIDMDGSAVIENEADESEENEIHNDNVDDEPNEEISQQTD